MALANAAFKRSSTEGKAYYVRDITHILSEKEDKALFDPRGLRKRRPLRYHDSLCLRSPEPMDATPASSPLRDVRRCVCMPQKQSPRF